MSQPGRLDALRCLVRDYGRYVARFEEIARYLHEQQPRAFLLWGRHDIFFDSAEVVSWLQDLPRMEAHVLDGRICFSRRMRWRARNSSPSSCVEMRLPE